MRIYCMKTSVHNGANSDRDPDNNKRRPARMEETHGGRTRPGGHVAFEVGEVRGGKIRLDEAVVPLGEAAGLATIGIWINTQRFTKTSNIWGVSNNTRGTNTNRVVVFQKS